jgi:transposase
MPYRIAGIDVHKKVLAVVVADVASEGAYEFERRQFGTSPERLRELAVWLGQQEVEEAVMESTAQYWKPVWEALERDWQPTRCGLEGAGPNAGKLHLAQAKSNRGAEERLRGRRAFGQAVGGAGTAAELRARRGTALVADGDSQEAPVDATKGTVAKPVGMPAGRSACEAFQHHFGSARRQRAAHTDGAGGGGDQPRGAGALADRNLRATPQELCDALSASAGLNPVYRLVLKMYLKELELLEEQMTQLDQEIASLLKEHEEAVQRLAEVPGLGVDSAQQIIARSGLQRRRLSHGQKSLLLGGSMPRGRAKCAGKQEQPVAQRESNYA